MLIARLPGSSGI